MRALSVVLHGQQVGTLELFEDETQRFTFDESYGSLLQNQRPVLGQIFEDRLPDPIEVGGPFCWFAHLLPQGVMRRWRANLLGIDQDDTFGFLERLGSDLPGAVVMSPSETSFRVKGRHPPLVNELPSEASKFQFSLAGAQWKLSARSAGRGLTTAASAGGTSYIAKFHSPEYPALPQCEFATMNWAGKSGIDLPEFELRHVSDFDHLPEEMPLGDGSVFVIERFDRAIDQRIHMEDFGQILDRPPGTHQTHGAHEELGSVLKWIAPDSRESFLKQVVFNIICGNGDAHLKNFSVLYPDRRNALLSPAYDLVATILYAPEGKEDLSLKLNNQRRFEDVRLASFDPLLIAMDFSTDRGYPIIRGIVEAAMEAWNTEDVQSNYTKTQIDRLKRHIASLPLCAKTR